MIIVWPQYLNRNLTLSQGRKISLKDAVKNPSINDVERALKRLRLKYELEKNKAYPGKWYEKSGRALVEWDKSKLELIREISLKIKEMRN